MNEAIKAALAQSSGYVTSEAYDMLAVRDAQCVKEMVRAYLTARAASTGDDYDQQIAAELLLAEFGSEDSEGTADLGREES